MTQTNVADVGLIGLAVMGKNLALNIADHGFKTAVYNRTTEVMTEFVAQNPDTPGGLVGCASLGELLGSLKRPRKIVVMVKAGTAVDAVVEQLLAAGLEADDLVVDGGNSYFQDTIAREKKYAGRLKFFGSGVSGGEIGARFGPSLMPGGAPESWKHLEPIWLAISAKVDAKTGKPLEDYAPGKPVVGGEPCAAYIGPNGAGHYVKMVHNAIEYVDMQLIGEAYWFLRHFGGGGKGGPARPDELAAIFAEYNQGDLDSYLIQITADILGQRDPRNQRKFLVDVILDAAGQKGTGQWTSRNALDLGIPANAMAEAVFARSMSALKEERVVAAKAFRAPTHACKGSRKALVDSVRDALYCSKICAYAQGFQLMRAAQREYGWKLNFGQIASIWRGGCIIRARFLQKITDAYARNPELTNLLLDPYFKKQIAGTRAKNGPTAERNWRNIVALSAQTGLAAPAFMSALAYFDGYRSAVLPAGLLQAQRDYFGAHTYERTDEPRGKFFHVDWPDPGRPEQASD
jgi:6-phosphogluconate dehydrogenase